MKNYIIGEKNGRCVVASEKVIIENALQQEKDGIKPHYSFYDCKNGEKARDRGSLHNRPGIVSNAGQGHKTKISRHQTYRGKKKSAGG